MTAVILNRQFYTSMMSYYSCSETVLAEKKFTREAGSGGCGTGSHRHRDTITIRHTPLTISPSQLAGSRRGRRFQTRPAPTHLTYDSSGLSGQHRSTVLETNRRAQQLPQHPEAVCPYSPEKPAHSSGEGLLLAGGSAKPRGLWEM